MENASYDSLNIAPYEGLIFFQRAMEEGMQLQLTLELSSLPGSLRLLEKIEGEIDIVAVGTP